MGQASAVSWGDAWWQFAVVQNLEMVTGHRRQAPAELLLTDRTGGPGAYMCRVLAQRQDQAVQLGMGGAHPRVVAGQALVVLAAGAGIPLS